MEAIAPIDYFSECEFIKIQWQKNLGVEINWKLYEWEEFFKELENNPPQIYMLVWIASYIDPDYFLRVSFFRQNAGWENQYYEDLVKEAQRSMDKRKRIQLYKQADKIFTEAAVLIPILYSREHQMVKPWIKRYPLAGSLLFKNIVLEDHL